MQSDLGACPQKLDSATRRRGRSNQTCWAAVRVVMPSEERAWWERACRHNSKVVSLFIG
jgi:hypothetical protein